MKTITYAEAVTNFPFAIESLVELERYDEPRWAAKRRVMQEYVFSIDEKGRLWSESGAPSDACVWVDGEWKQGDEVGADPES